MEYQEQSRSPMNLTLEHLTRQADIIPTSIHDEQITIIGAGATGSRIAFDLAKSGFNNIEVWDYDNVDTVNLNTQFYKHSDVGRAKVEALQANIEEFTGYKISIENKKYEAGTVFDGMVVCALDSMEGRRNIWESHVKQGFMTKLVLDPRMGAEFAALYCMQPSRAEDINDYEKTLHSDSDSEQAPCTARATAYTAGLAAGMVVASIKGYLTERKYVRIMQWDIAGGDCNMWLNPVYKEVETNPVESQSRKENELPVPTDSQSEYQQAN